MPPKHAGGGRGGNHGGPGNHQGPGQHGNGGQGNVAQLVRQVQADLQKLKDGDHISPMQFKSIMAQLPDEQGRKAEYVDEDIDPSEIAKQAQDPRNPAHPQHPQHKNWAATAGKQVGKRVLMGGGMRMLGGLF